MIFALFSHPITEAKAVFFVSLWDATMAFSFLINCKVAEAFRPVRFARVPIKSKLVELLPPRLRQSLAVAPSNNPLPKAKAIFFVTVRNATVTFALFVDRQIAEAFRAIRFEGVPNKSKLVELLPPRLRQSLCVALLFYRSTKAKAIYL